MASLIIGDFRALQLQQYQNIHSNNGKLNYKYLLEDDAEYSWFNTNVQAQLPLKTSDIQSIVIMLGFNDCVYSCVWDAFNINIIVNNYIKTINELSLQYESIDFYVCSIPPVNSGYPFAGYDNDIISAEVLNDKIKQFNNKIKECKATYIDCSDYLVSTNFNTYDGVRYSSDICEPLLTFILSHVKGSGGSEFNARLKEEDTPFPDSDNVESDQYWVAESYGGLNPFSASGSDLAKSPGDVLPSCAAYVWGRFYEILGYEPKLPINMSVNNWFDYKEDGYGRGKSTDKPELGSIMCWKSFDNKSGYVAIVEKVLSNGNIRTSDSNALTSKYWGATLRTNENGNWGEDTSKYTFQGFIYNPTISDGQVYDYIDKSKVTSSNESIKGKTQENNAVYIWQYLRNKDWSINAVAALLGNIQAESAINPGRYEAYTYNKESEMWLGPNPTKIEVDNYLAAYKAKKGRYPGFGLTQWTSKDISNWSEHKLISWCEERGYDAADIDSQLERINWEALNNKQWYGYQQDKIDYPISFKDFITSVKEPEWLAAAFLLRYEIPANRYSKIETRQIYARNWYNILLNYTPESFFPSFTVSNFTIDKVTSTEINCSFLGSQISKSICKATDEHNNEKIFTGGTSLSKPELIIIKNKGLSPNTEYRLEISVNSAVGNKTITHTLAGKTLQDYPRTVNEIKLITKDAKLPNEKFELITNTLSDSDWGYWGKNNHGYIVQLIVNGKVKQEKTVETLNKNLNFNLGEYFTEYKSKVGDIIQIGIRTWVTDDDNNIIFDSQAAKTSNTVCFMKKPTIVYLNKD